MWNTDKALYGKRASQLMKTDVHETEEGYELNVDLPGFSKDEINVELKNGYLTISAAKGLDKEETDKRPSASYVRSVTAAAARGPSTLAT